MTTKLEQSEPVAWSISNPKTVQDFSFYQTQTYTKPLYAAPVQQAEQEPVAIDWDKAHEILCDVWNRVISADDGFDELQDLIYTAPVRTKDLTDCEIEAIDDANWENDHKTWDIKKFARAVIAADRALNNPSSVTTSDV